MRPLDLIRSGSGNGVSAMDGTMTGFDRMVPEMLALLQSGEHHGSRQEANS